APEAGGKVVASDEGGEVAAGGDKGERADEGTVVGAMVSGNTVHVEQAASIGGVKAVPAVRALAKKLKVDLARVKPTGAGGVVTMQDVKNAAASGSDALGAAPAASRAPAATTAAAPVAAPQRSTLSQSGKPMRTTPPSVQATG